MKRHIAIFLVWAVVMCFMGGTASAVYGMDCFAVNKMKVKDKDGTKKDKITIKGTLKLADGADPFDPATDDVTVAVGPGEFTIPAGSFVEEEPLGANSFEFEGTIFDLGKVTICLKFDECSWKMKIKKGDASGFYDGNSDVVTVALTIGDHYGEDTISWTKNKVKKAKFKADPQVNCCDVGNYNCTRNPECQFGEYCAKPVGDCDGFGSCTPIPEICWSVYAPVCGCEGNTYPSACEAAMFSVNVAYEGECVP